MILIILKSSICLLMLWLFYKLSLESLPLHRLKRFYLLGSILLSAIIPWITFTSYVEVSASNNIVDEVIMQKTIILPEKTTDIEPHFASLLPGLLWGIYGFGVLIFLFRFCINLYRIFYKIQTHQKIKSKPYIQVLLESLEAPHTFMNYIFYDKNQFINNDIPQEVILHEQAHSDQKHSIDVVFLELLQIVFWFNPLLVFIKKDIKLNHEFLADKAVLNHGYSSITYQQLLLKYTINSCNTTLVNAINYSSIKKRFTVMNSHPSKPIVLLKFLLIFPLLSVLIVGFSTKKEVKIPTSIIQSNFNNSQSFEQSSDTSYISKERYYQNATFKIIDKQKGISEYFSYQQLTNELKSKLLPSITKTAIRRPTKTQLLQWRDKKKFGVWLDNKRIDNEILTQYNTEDISLFNVSKLEKNAKNYGKHQYQVVLCTNNKFDALFNQPIKTLDSNSIIEITKNRDKVILRVSKNDFQLASSKSKDIAIQQKDSATVKEIKAYKEFIALSSKEVRNKMSYPEYRKLDKKMRETFNKMSINQRKQVGVSKHPFPFPPPPPPHPTKKKKQ